MKNKKLPVYILLAVVFSLFVITLYNEIPAVVALFQQEPSDKKLETGKASETITIESIVDACRAETEQEFPGHNFVNYDAEGQMLIIAFWVEGSDDAAATVIKDSTANFDDWNELICQAEDYCATWQNKFDLAGFHNVTVVVHSLNPSNLDNSLITAARGKLFYDVVSEYFGVAMPASVKNETLTLGQENALKSAQSYLSVSSFSYSRLVDQLEYEGYTEAEAYYAVDHCGANWYEQAAKSAAAYLRSSSFSRSRLIEQLEYEGFTHDQAVYGVEQNGY